MSQHRGSPLPLLVLKRWVWRGHFHIHSHMPQALISKHITMAYSVSLELSHSTQYKYVTFCYTCAHFKLQMGYFNCSAWLLGKLMKEGPYPHSLDPYNIHFSEKTRTCSSGVIIGDDTPRNRATQWWGEM